jgi:hypothetical protein
MMYSKPVVLNRDRHSNLTLSPSPTGYRFASDVLSVMLAAPEFFDAGRFYPIIFTVGSDNGVTPLALLGLEEKENLFVDEDGTWDAPYIPAYFRRYPFVTTGEADGKMIVCFDDSYDGFNLDGGAPLFEDGEPAAKTGEIQAFLQDYFLQMQQTMQFGAMLQEKGLLRKISAQANLVDGRKYALNDMFVIDEQKLAQLSDEDVLTLFRSGMLALVHAHLLSLRNFSSLVNRKSTREHRQ